MEEEKALITITSCNRIDLVKKFIWDYVSFVSRNKKFHFLLALDGSDPEYISFAKNFEIPILFSEEREGVGLSKNRVLKEFPSYDYYFFLDDDIELIDESIFNDCLQIMKKKIYPHLCGNHIKTCLEKEYVDQFTLIEGMTGGGYFTCYSKEGVDKVGGFHTAFVKYKRFGHSEHSYRFFHQGLQPFPFIYYDEGFNKLIIHSPESVSSKANLRLDNNEWIKEEKDLIDKKNSYFPITTLCSYEVNGSIESSFQKAIQFLAQNPKRYPLTSGKERSKALAEYYALMIPKKKGGKKIIPFIKSLWYNPTNVALKHSIKKKLFGRN